MPPAKRRPTQAEQDALRGEILRLHADGVSRNEIMRRTGASARMVSGTVADAGATFARAPEVQAATTARRIDLDARRIDLAHRLHVSAEKLVDQMWQPGVIYNFGGKDNTYEEHHVSEPPASDKRSLMSTAGMAIDRSLKLVPPRTDDGADSARSMLGKIMTGLAEVWNEQQQGEASEGAGDAP